MANEELQRIIGHNVRRLRRKAGYSQAILAEMVNREASAITNIERGKRMVGVDLLCTFAAIFSVSVDILLLPEGSASSLGTINSMLSGQSSASLAHLEPIIRVWLSEYGDPKPPEKKSKQASKKQEG